MCSGNSDSDKFPAERTPLWMFSWKFDINHLKKEVFLTLLDSLKFQYTKETGVNVLEIGYEIVFSSALNYSLKSDSK